MSNILSREMWMSRVAVQPLGEHGCTSSVSPLTILLFRRLYHPSPPSNIHFPSSSAFHLSHIQNLIGHIPSRTHHPTFYILIIWFPDTHSTISHSYVPNIWCSPFHPSTCILVTKKGLECHLPLFHIHYPYSTLAFTEEPYFFAQTWYLLRNRNRSKDKKSESVESVIKSKLIL